MIRTVSHMYAIGENMHMEPGVESGALRRPWWDQYWSCPYVVDSTDKHSGTYSAKYTRSYDAAMGRRQGAICQTQKWVFGGTYRCSAWVKATAGEQFIIECREVNSHGPVQTEGGGAVTFTADGTWQYQETTVFPLVVTNRPLALGVIVINAPLDRPPGIVIQLDDLRVWRVT